MTDALSKLTGHGSLILNNLELLKTRNWRDATSIWDKLAKCVYKRNRFQLRAKLMNIWRNNNWNIKSQVTQALTLPKDKFTLPISINISELPDIRNPNMLFSHSDSSLESDISSIISIESTVQVSSKIHIVQSTNRGEFELTGQEWFRIFPNFSESALKSGWTTLFNDKMSVYYPFCVLKFLYHRINKNYSKRGCVFLIATAVCKFSNCITFKFEMETPQTNASNLYLINYIATGSISKEHSSNSISHSRHLSGERREATAKQLEFSSPSNLHYSLFAHSQNLSVAKKGNFNYLHSTDVIRKVKSQHFEKSRFNNDMWQDIISTQMSYMSTIIGNTLNGYIQFISHSPFIIHLYSEEQIMLLKKLEKESFTLHLDATGPVIRKLDHLRKRILYYAISVKHPLSHVSPIPLAEMVSSEQTNIEISHLLNRWLYDVKKVTSSEILPNKVEVDFSWAMLHGVCNAFNKQNLEWYLNRCWETIHTSNSTNSIKVIIHICSAHIMNQSV